MSWVRSNGLKVVGFRVPKAGELCLNSLLLATTKYSFLGPGALPRLILAYVN